MKRFLINNPESMLKVRVVTVKDGIEQALKTLHRIGVLHVEEAKELALVDRAALETERRQVSELLTFVNRMLGYLPQKERVPLPEDVEVIYTRPFHDVSDEVETLYHKTDKLNTQLVSVDEEIERTTEQTKYLSPLVEQGEFRLKDLSFNGGYISAAVLVMPSTVYEALSDRIGDHLLEGVAAIVGEEAVLYAITRAREMKTVVSLVADAGGRALSVPDEDSAVGDFVAAADERLAALQGERDGLLKELEVKVREDLQRLVLLREALTAENERLAVLEKAAEAKYVNLIEGWIPQEDEETAISEVRQALPFVYIDTRKPDEDEEPPIKLRNFRPLRPFQVIINLFGLPKYREWDPTPIIAYSFAFFFGLMTNDVVYGLGIIVLGRFLLGGFVDDREAPSFKLFQRMIYTCGAVSAVMGLISGTYLGDIYRLLGFENLALSAAISERLLNPLSFIVIALFIGFIHINLAHILSLIQAIKQKDFARILNKIGLFTLQLGVPTILHAVLKIDVPFFTPQLYSIFLYVMFGSVVVVLVSFIMQRGGLGLLLGVFDVIGLVGDIMSYTRLAGVGLATYYLAFCFNLIAELFSNLTSGAIPGVIGTILGTILAVLILIFGHVLNTILAGIGSFVHSLRLCFVEFMFKFYEGGGREYSPFKLRKRASVLITTKP